MLIFTVTLNNTISNAIILATSLKSYHPNLNFWLIHGEPLPKNFELPNNQFDKIIYFHELNIKNYHSWIFQFSSNDVCKIISILAFNYLFKNTSFKNIVYFSPETLILNNLDALFNIIQKNNITLTPIFSNYTTFIESLTNIDIYDIKKSLYNNSFIAINKTLKGEYVIKWLSDVILNYTNCDFNHKIFDTQYFFDLLPYFFINSFILQDPGYGVSPINVCERNISVNEQNIFYSNNSPLYFFHFFGSDTGAGKLNCSYFINSSEALRKLWNLYDNLLNIQNHKFFNNLHSFFDFFDNGKRIVDKMRIFYRNRPDIRKLYPYPQITNMDSDNFFNWLTNNYNNIFIKRSFFYRFRRLIYSIYKDFISLCISIYKSIIYKYKKL
jgi:hypothetical protein